MRTETHLALTIDEARELADKLNSMADELENTGQMGHVRHVCEQVDDPGPWRLILSVNDPS